MAVIEISSRLDCAVPTPVRIPVPAAQIPAGEGLRLVPLAGGKNLPAQRIGDEVVATLGTIKAGEKLRYRLEKGSRLGGVRVESGENTTSIHLPEGVFTVYTTDPKIARPFFHPLHGPGQQAMTRAYPMQDVSGETRDHPHHRSFWTAYGEVNGVDDWSETPGKHGFIRHQRFDRLFSGPVVGGFAASAQWVAMDGKPLLDERRAIHVYNVGPDLRLCDYEVHLIAAHGDVHYGDTKEGGILALRVATPMDGNKGGRMENSRQGVSEKQVWGKKAEWLDYSGTPGGPGTRVLGIAMMDHPGNLNYPCYWHARDYGLVGTNPFARAAFEKGQPNTGHVQPRNTTLTFRYRLLLHPGGAKEARVDEAYHAWIQGPEGKVVG